jgi:hypothetical protein
MQWFTLAFLILGLFGATIPGRHLREAKLLGLLEVSLRKG